MTFKTWVRVTITFVLGGVAATLTFYGSFWWSFLKTLPFVGVVFITDLWLSEKWTVVDE